MKILVVSLILIFLNPSAYASSARGLIGSCRYYDQLSNELGCGPDDYFLKYGATFCREFKKNDESFSPEGRTFLRLTRACLQRAFEKERGLTCANSRARSVRTHITCFERYRFCALPFYDKFLIFRTIAPAIFDREMPGGASDFEAFCS